MIEVALLIIVGFCSGVVNAVAGGGNLLVLPVFLTLGLNPFTAVITGSLTVAPASIAAAFGYRQDLRKVPRYYFLLLIPCILGAAIGLSLLHNTPSNLFEKFLPWLILTALLLFLFHPQLHRRLQKRVHLRSRGNFFVIAFGLLFACVYGGYFGAGVGFLVLTLLSWLNISTIFQITGLKAIVLSILGLMTIVAFSFTGELAWGYGLLTAVGSVCGGFIGARLLHRISPHAIRAVIVGIGVIVVAITFARAYL